MALGAILNQTFDGYTKEQTLSDQTRTLLGLPSNSTPDDAFQALFLTSTGGNVFSLTVLYPDGTPWAGLTLSGVTNLQGGPATTDSEGKALVSSQSSNPTVTGANDYIDINPINQRLSKDSGIVTYVTIRTTTNNANVNKIVKVTNDTSFKVSKFITRMDVGLCGGGGGGGDGFDSGSTYGGGGGGDGWIESRNGIQPSTYGNTINITIGKGGEPGDNNRDYSGDEYLSFAGEDGGNTIFRISGGQGLTLTAQGGQGGGKARDGRILKGGTGNTGRQSGGNGCYYTGSNSSSTSATAGSYGGYFSIAGQQINCGGGGGGGNSRYLDGDNPGGYPYGGRGYKYYGDTSSDTSATGTGGGGGGGYGPGGNTAGRGGDGIVAYILYTS